MQATEIDLLLFIVRLTGAVNIEAAGLGANAWQFIQVEEAKAQDKFILCRAHVIGQNNLTLILLTDISKPHAGMPAGNGILVDYQAILFVNVGYSRLQKAHSL